MKIKAQKGFSLAEVLISLTVVSIMLAVAAPVLTKHTVGDNAWQWTQGEQTKNGTSFDGNNIVIGGRSVPTAASLGDFDGDGYNYFNYYPAEELEAFKDTFLREANDSLYMDVSNNRLISKLSIIKAMSKDNPLQPKRNVFTDSHISFYNIVNGETEYAGRLVADSRDVGLGIGTFQGKNSLVQTIKSPEYFGVAIGHYASSSRDPGSQNVSLGYGALSRNTTQKSVGIGYHVNAKGNENTLVMNDINRDIFVQGQDNLIIGNYTDDVNEGSINSFGNSNIFIGKNAGLGRHNMGMSDRLAIGNVEPNATGETGVELIQGNLGYDNKKLIVNGDFVVKSSDGSKTLFKVDATGLPIDYNQDRDASIRRFDNVSGPDRCEGAAVCIGMFKVPFADCGFLSPESTTIDAYDIYMPQMAVGVYHSSLKKIPYLGAALLYLDRYKDTKGSIISILEKRDSIFSEIYGVNPDGLGIIDFVGALLGLSDARLKNIYGDSTAGLKEINALKIKNYTYKADKTKTPHVGVIAQELQKIFPNSVIEGADGYLSIKQEEMFYGLVNSIQELSKKNDKVSEKIALSKEKVEYTNAQNELIEQENKLLEKQNKEFAKRIAKLQKNK